MHRVRQWFFAFEGVLNQRNLFFLISFGPQKFLKIHCFHIEWFCTSYRFGRVVINNIPIDA